ncbi:MAG: winged helix-turn-helix domain-containing protein [Gammaproteobacteria bacterium]|nr:winged helix-turn-helix domain-containing protein [Gammaproteobacteria bacterium]
MAGLIGTAAGVVWSYLNINGASSVTKITKETDLDAKGVQRAIGWLASEGKLTIDMKGRTETVSLK